MLFFMVHKSSFFLKKNNIVRVCIALFSYTYSKWSRVASAALTEVMVSISAHPICSAASAAPSSSALDICSAIPWYCKRNQEGWMGDLDE